MAPRKRAHIWAVGGNRRATVSTGGPDLGDPVP